MHRTRTIKKRSLLSISNIFKYPDNIKVMLTDKIKKKLPLAKKRPFTIKLMRILKYNEEIMHGYNIMKYSTPLWIDLCHVICGLVSHDALQFARLHLMTGAGV